MTGPGLLALAALLPLLALSAASDLRHLRIPNRHVLLALALFAVTAPLALTLPELGGRLAVAAVAFGLGFGLFALGLFGGGDVKLFPVLLLFIPMTDQILYLRLFSGALLVTCLGVAVLQRLPQPSRPGWTSAQLKGHVPVAVAMALSVVLYAALAARAMLG
jgi:prepilin peptidase CpaA